MEKQNNIFTGWTYNPPAPGCTHWSITNAHGEEIGCPHIGLPQELIDFINTPTQPQKAEDNAPKPTSPRPLTYTPPANAPYRIPIGEGYGMTTPAAQWVEANGISTDALLNTLTNPTRITSGKDDNPLYHSPAASVAVSKTDPYLILAVFPPRPERHVSTSQPKAPSGGAGKPRYQNTKELIRALEKEGMTVEQTGGKHYKTYDPENPTQSVFFPSTPSEWRSLVNCAAEIRRTFPNLNI